MSHQKSILLSFSMFTTLVAHGGLVFQADWNGADSGTGGATDIVTLGGTGSLSASSPTNSSSSVEASPSLGSGNVFKASREVTGGAYTLLTPTNAASSFESWFSVNGGQSSLNGGFDFFYRRSNDVASNSAFRPLQLSSSDVNGLSLTFQSLSSSKLRVSLGTRTSGGIEGDPDDVSQNQNDYTYGGMLADTDYHFAFTASTDAAGVVTLKTFLKEGLGEIDTTSSDDLVGTSSINFVDNIVTSGLGSNAFAFGIINGAGGVRDEYFDTFRIYNDVPTTFAAIPEPASYALMVALFSGAFLVLRRR